MNIIIAVTGGISAYKSCDLINMLRKGGHDVRVIMTENAKQFITPMTLATLSKHPIMDNMWEERKGSVDHIDIAMWAEMFVVYPATANIIGKFAHGIADDLLSTVFLAIPAETRKIIFPAMNTNMYENPIVQNNLGILSKTSKCCSIFETRTGQLACGTEGKGCLLQPKEAMKRLELWLKPVHDEPLTKDEQRVPIQKSENEIMADLKKYEEFVQFFGFGCQLPSFGTKFGYDIVCRADGSYETFVAKKDGR